MVKTSRTFLYLTSSFPESLSRSNVYLRCRRLVYSLWVKSCILGCRILGGPCLLCMRVNVKVKPTLCLQWQGGGEADGTHRHSALRRITDNWRVMLSRSPADRCQSACSKSRGYALLFFPYTAINPVFSPVCEECRRIPMTRLRPARP